MTVYDNMAFSLTMRKESKKLIDERVKEAAKLLQIENNLYAKPADISGGQRQRVALGRAIVRKPKVFLMDEPLSNLDAKLREHMRVELVRLHKQLGTTSIYVTHDQTEAMTMATRIILLDKGKVQQVGKPDEFYNKPSNIFVARFIGSPTMNILEGEYKNGRFISQNSSITLKPSDQDEEFLRSYEGKRVSMGIRPERFVDGDKFEDSFEAVVDVVEMLGKEKTIFAKLDDGADLVISVPGHHEFSEGERHEFGFDKSAIHFFDADTGERINR